MSANSAVINALQAGFERAKEKYAVAFAMYEKVKAELDDANEECSRFIMAIAEEQSRELSTPQVVSRSTPQVVSRPMAQVVSRSTPQVVELSMAQVVSRSTPQVVSRSTPQVVELSMAQAVSRSTPQAVSRPMAQAVSQSMAQAVSQSTPQAVSRSTALVQRSPEVVDLSTLHEDTTWRTVEATPQYRIMCTVITYKMFEATSPEEATYVLYENMGEVEIMPNPLVLQTQKGDWKIKFAIPSSALKDVDCRRDRNGKKVWKFNDLEIRTFNPNHVPSHDHNGSDNGSNGSSSRITLGDFFYGN